MDIFLVVVGLLLLFLSGNWLVVGSVQIARYFKISSLIVGLTVVALGTSAPELFVSLKAAYKGSSDISIGNVVGSNIANIGIVLGIVALIFPIKVSDSGIWRDWLVMLLASVLLIVLSLDLKLEFFEGVALVSGLAIYLVWTIHMSRKHGSKETVNKPTLKLHLAIFYVLIAMVGLYFGAGFMVDGARSIALRLGYSERVIGITVVAFGTSVPELVTSLMAVLKKENEISIGNIIGSNIFNIMAVLGITSLIHPIQVNPEILRFDYFWMLGFALVLLLVMLPLKKGLVCRKDAFLLFSVYCVYVYLLF